MSPTIHWSSCASILIAEARCDCGAEKLKLEQEAKARARHDYQVAIGAAEPVQAPPRVERVERILDGVLVLGGVMPDGSLQLLGVDNHAPAVPQEMKLTPEESAALGAQLEAAPDYETVMDPSLADLHARDLSKAPELLQEEEKPWPLPAWAGEQLAEHHRLIAERTIERLRRRGLPIPPELVMTAEKKREIAMAVFPGADRIGPKTASRYPPLPELDEGRLPNYVTQPVPRGLEPDQFSETSDPKVDDTIDSSTPIRAVERRLTMLRTVEVLEDASRSLRDGSWTPAGVAADIEAAALPVGPNRMPCVDCGLPESAHPFGKPSGKEGCGGYR